MSRFKPSPPSQLLQAIRSDDLTGVKAALEAGGDPDEADMHGHKGVPLRTACFNGNLEIITLLLSKGADINVAGFDGPAMPLRLAFRNKQKNVVELLINNGSIVPAELDLQSIGISSETSKKNEPISQTRSDDKVAPPREVKPELTFADENSPLPFIPAAQKFSEYKAQDLDLLLDDFSNEENQQSTPEINTEEKQKKGVQLESMSFDLPQQNEIEHIDLEAVYGVDTNVLTADLLKLATPQTATKNPDTQEESQPIKRSGFWKLKR